MFTRRNLLKAGLVGGANLALPIGCSDSSSDYDLGLGTAASADSLPNPTTTPFVAPLPIPPLAGEVASFGSPAPSLLGNGPGTKFYEIVEEERLVRMHPELPPTRIWGYRDARVPSWGYALGPTFQARMTHEPGNPRPPVAKTGVVLRVHNNLPCTPQTFGYNYTTVHLHGGHTLPIYDGFPTLDFGPGQKYDYVYPMHCPGFLTGEPATFDVPSTMWYHDHTLDFTGPNVYKGLAGVFVVFDALDPGDETNHAGLGLPSGRFDIPLVLQDKIFNPDGSLVYDTFRHEGFIGNKFLVNGVIQPYLRVKRRKYRFRVLDASNARFYQLFLTEAGGATFPFTVIATDGGLLSRSIAGIESFTIAPAERIEVVVDFSQFPTGTEVYLENRLQQDSGLGPGALGPPYTQIMKFIVEDSCADPSRVPRELRAFDPIGGDVLARAVRQSFEFGAFCPQTDPHCQQTSPIWLVNGQVSGNLSVAMVSPALDAPQVWTLRNTVPVWTHPVHIHHAFMRVLRRYKLDPATGNPAADEPLPHGERDGIARRDTCPVGPAEGVDIFVQFRDFKGSFVMHCHNLEHEDMAMMARFDVI